MAVLRRLLGRVTLPDTLPGSSPASKILEVIDRLGELQELRASVQERARKSEVVAAFESELRELLRGLLRRAFREAVPASQLDSAVDAFMATASGVYAQGLNPRDRRRVLRFALRKLLGE